MLETQTKPAEVPAVGATETAPAKSAAAPAPTGTAAAAESQPPVVLNVDNIGKRFKIYRKPLHRLREWVLGGKHHTEFWAVRGVSFEVRQGECLGIIGENGSGKSTLLKIVAGALRATEGTCIVQGRVLSLIELGTGLNPQLAGRANIVHAATLLGFPANFAREKMEEIEAFAELGEFFDRPVMLYSSGMRVRLAFSMFACFRPKLFIVDEALSVGDIFFQQKCAVRIRELLEGGMTMLFVSHDQSAILNLCDRAMVMSKGRPIFYGEPEEAVTSYIASLRQNGRPRSKWGSASPGLAKLDPAGGSPSSSRAATMSSGNGAAGGSAGNEVNQIVRRDMIGDRHKHRHGNGKLKIVACRITDADGRDTVRASMGNVLCFHVIIEAHEEVAAPRTGIRFFDRFNNMVFGAGSYQHRMDLPALRTGERILVRFDVKMDVAQGQYTFGLGASEPSDEGPQSGVACDRLDLLGPIFIGNPDDGHRPFYGIARLPLTMTIKPLNSEPTS